MAPPTGTSATRVAPNEATPALREAFLNNLVGSVKAGCSGRVLHAGIKQRITTPGIRQLVVPLPFARLWSREMRLHCASNRSLGAPYPGSGPVHAQGRHLDE